MDAPSPAAEKPTVFVSYAREDRDFARELVALLQERGIEAQGDWLLASGEDYEQRLRELILSADAFAFVITPSSIASSACRGELAVAVETKKPVLPLARRDHQDDSLLDSALRKPQWTFFRDGDDFPSAADALARAIRTDFALMAMHSRLLTASEAWENSGRLRGYLLPKDSLHEAEQWLGRTRGEPDKLPQATQREIEYIVASQHDRVRTSQRTAVLAIVVGIALLGLSAAAWWQRSRALEQTRTAEARYIAGQADRLKLLSHTTVRERAMLALQAHRIHPGPEGNAALADALTSINHYTARVRIGDEQIAVSANGLYAVHFDTAKRTARVFSTAGHAVAPLWTAALGTGEADVVRGLAVSPNGNQVAVLVANPCLLLLTGRGPDGAAAELLREPCGDWPPPFTHLQFNESGDYLWMDGQLLQAAGRIVHAGQPAALISLGEPKPNAVTVSPSGKLLATMSWIEGKDVLSVHALPGMALLARFPFSCETLRTMVFSPSEDDLAIASDDALYTVVTDWRHSRFVRPIKRDELTKDVPLPATIRFLNNDVAVLATGGKGTERVEYDTDYAREEDPPDPARTRAVVYVVERWAFQPDVIGKILMIAKDINAYANSGDVTTIGVRRDAILTTDMGGRLTFWDPLFRFGSPRGSLGELQGFAVPGRGKSIYATRIERSHTTDPTQEVLHIERIDDWSSFTPRTTPVARSEGDTRPYGPSDVAPDESFVALPDHDPTTKQPVVRLSYRSGATRLLRFAHPQKKMDIGSIAISADGTEVMAIEARGRATIWNLSPDERRPPITVQVSAPSHAMALSSDLRFVVAGDQGGVEAWRISGEAAERVWKQATDDVGAVAISADGRLLAIGTTAGTVTVYRDWKTAHPKVVRTLTLDSKYPEYVQMAPVYSLAFHPTEEVLAVSDAFELRLFDLSQDGPLMRVPQASARMQTFVRFSADGRWVISALAGMENYLAWQWKPEDLAADACSSFLFRTAFSDAEWQALVPFEKQEPPCPKR